MGSLDDINPNSKKLKEGIKKLDEAIAKSDKEIENLILYGDVKKLPKQLDKIEWLIIEYYRKYYNELSRVRNYINELKNYEIECRNALQEISEKLREHRKFKEIILLETERYDNKE